MVTAKVVDYATVNYVLVTNSDPLGRVFTVTKFLSNGINSGFSGKRGNSESVSKEG